MTDFAATFKETLATALPLKSSPLVQCITNEITCESMANALLYLDAKPVMADYPREFSEFFAQSSALLLNLGHISETRQENLLTASRYAKKTQKPTVVDIVGASATNLRNELAQQLLANEPNVLKGNYSEMRRFCGLESRGRGVDASSDDQSKDAITELAAALKKRAQQFPDTTFLATGAADLVVEAENSWLLTNGVGQLDRFTGTGDIVGALIAAFLGTGLANTAAVVTAVSYFNCCGEHAASTTRGLADFRQETLNQLSLLMEKNWHEQVTGEKL